MKPYYQFTLLGLLITVHCLLFADKGLAQTPASVRRLPVDTKKLPAGVVVKGQVVKAERWQDKSGEHLLVLTHTKPANRQKEPDSDGIYTFDQALYGYQFDKTGNTVKQLWAIQDFVKACPLDISCEFLLPSVQLTDLDADGVAETSFLYRTGCRSDVSPASLKFILHNGPTKYALRGETVVMGEGGKYTTDPAFNTADKRFLSFAKQQWARFKKEF
jgi:hypothetical protein